MGMALLLLAIDCFVRGANVRIPGVAWVVMSCVLIPWLQLCFGLLLYSGDAWISSLYLLGFGLAIGVGYSFASTKDDDLAPRVAIVILLTSCISAAMGLRQTFSVGEDSIWIHSGSGILGMRAEGNLAQPNNLATLLGLGFVSLVLLREHGRLSGTASTMMALLLLLGIVATQSRTSLLFGPAIITAWVWLSKRVVVSTRTRVHEMVILTALHWLLVWVWSGFLDAMLLSEPGAAAGRGLETPRFAAWQTFFGALEQSPWVGYGWMQAGAAQLAVAEKFSPVGGLFSQAHNLFIELIVWNGYPLGILLISLLAYWFISRLRRISGPEAMCAYLAVLVILVHSMLELPYHYAYFLVPAGVWIGIIEASAGGWSLRARRFHAATGALAAVLFLVVASAYPRLEETFRQARFEYLRIGTGHPSREAVSVPLASHLGAYVSFYKQEPHAGMTDTELQSLSRVMRRYPYALLIYGNAVAQALNGHELEAAQLFRKLHGIYGDEGYVAMREAFIEKMKELPTQRDIHIERIAPALTSTEKKKG